MKNQTPQGIYTDFAGRRRATVREHSGADGPAFPREGEARFFEAARLGLIAAFVCAYSIVILLAFLVPASPLPWLSVPLSVVVVGPLVAGLRYLTFAPSEDAGELVVSWRDSRGEARRDVLRRGYFAGGSGCKIMESREGVEAAARHAVEISGGEIEDLDWRYWDGAEERLDESAGGAPEDA